MTAVPTLDEFPNPKGDQPSELKGIGGRVLIADDDANVRDLLRHSLRRAGYDVVVACDGEEGQEKLEADEFDLVITDARMPRCDGFEFCRSIKSNAVTAHLPVLMVTAFGERNHKLEGIEAGATDFITKPVDVAYLSIRVRNAIQAKRLHDAVRENYRRLQELESMRERLVRMLAHDMSGPLKTVLQDLDLIRLHTTGSSEPCHEATLRASGETRRLISLVDDMAEAAALENAAMPVELDAVFLRPIIDLVLQGLEEPRGPQLRTRISPGVPAVVCDARLMRRVMENLVRNAQWAVREGGSIEVGLERLTDRPAVRLWVKDDGVAFPEEAEAFASCQGEHFFTLGDRVSDGLALRFCKLAVEAQRGLIGVSANDSGRGATFWCDLPLA